MTTNLGLRAGHDIRYHTDRTDTGHAGGMAYYTKAAGEPPGQWAGKGAAKLGLAGDVDAEVIRRLFHEDIGPDGDRLDCRKRGNYKNVDVEAEVAAYLIDHPFASATEIAEARTAAKGKNRNARPYFDFALGAAKSVSVLHASLIISSLKARDDGDEDLADTLAAEAAKIEDALYQTALVVVREIEATAAYTRTGHVSDTTGEWRDTAGVTAPIFVQHTSHEGDPHLHAHITVHNRVQLADESDPKYRTLDSRTLYAQRLRLAVLADREMETRMTALGWPMKQRPDRNGAEVDGVTREVIERFSSRRVAMTPEIEKLVAEYRAVHGHDPNDRALWLMRQHVSMKQRAKIDRERGKDWEKQTTADELRVLGGVLPAVRRAPGGARPVLDHAAKAKAARIAVAEAQKHNAAWTMTQLMFEVGRALPVMTASANSKALIIEVAKLAVSGRAGTEVVQVTAGDIADVDELGVRDSDGGSIFRPPHEAKFTTLPHLNLEEKVLQEAKREVPQLVSEEVARAEVAKTDLNAEQREAVVMMLTSVSATTALIAPAGSGKSHTMAAFAAIYTKLTRRRVIGLTTATNAARVLANEGLAESYNIAEFLGKNEGTDQLRRPVPLHANDVLVIDEATQVSTADYAMVQAAARQAGARMTPVGDTQQLGSVEAGGMFRLIAQEVPTAELVEVLRFNADWEAGPSVQLRAGDFAAIAAYDRHGRIRGADEQAAYEEAASMWLADHLRGKDVLLLAATNEEAAELSRLVQAKLVQLGKVGALSVQLGDGNQAGTGDLIRARLNCEIDAGGQKLTNRDTLRVDEIRGPQVHARRLKADGTWTAPFMVPRSYLKGSAELAYGGNVHVSQGRTVDSSHLLVTESLIRRGLYVGMTRGRESNIAHVVTGKTAPKGHKPFEQETPEAILKGVMQREEANLSAIEQIRQSQEWAGGTGHLLNLWSAAIRPSIYPEIDRMVKERLTADEGKRYDREYSRGVLQNKLRELQLAGHDVQALIDTITADSMEGARSIASVLFGRLEGVRLPEHAPGMSFSQRTPENASELAKELAAGLDGRAAALGERMADQPEGWVIHHLGMLSPDASPIEREDYARRAATGAAYREAAGITDPEQAISAEPHRSNPELECMRFATIKALEIAVDPMETMTRGELEALVLDGERAQDWAPPDVTSQLRLTSQAEADAWRQSADAEVAAKAREAADARALASQLAAEKARLEPMNATYEGWSGTTAAIRNSAGKAKAELARRGEAEEEPQQDSGDWWRELEANVAGVDRAIAAERAEAQAQGLPWPPEPEPEPEGALYLEAEAAIERLARDGLLPQPEDARQARLDELQHQADEAVAHIEAEEAERAERAEYVARTGREAQPEPEVQAEQADIEA